MYFANIWYFFPTNVLCWSFTWTCKKVYAFTYQPVLPSAMEMELSKRLHLDSLTTASLLAAGAITTNSRKPYLERQRGKKSTFLVRSKPAETQFLKKYCDLENLIVTNRLWSLLI